MSAQESPIPPLPADGSISSEQIEIALQAVEAREDLAEETRAEIMTELRRALAEVQARAAAEAEAEAFAAAIDSAPTEVERLRAELDQTADGTPALQSLGVNDGMALEELEQILAREAAEAANAQGLLNEVESALAAQQDRPAAIRARSSEVQDSLDELSATLSTPAPAGGNSILSEARRLNVLLTRDARRAELLQLEQEQLSYDLRLELLRTRREAAEFAADQAAQRVELLQAVINRERQAAAQRAQTEAAEAELAAAGKHPALREIAEGNLELTRELPAVAAEIEQATNKLKAVEDEIQQVEQALMRARQRLEIGGITQAIGRFFVDERRSLPRYSEYRLDVRERRKALADLGLAQVRVEEKRRDLTSIDPAVEEVMNAVGEDIDDPAELDRVQGEAEELLRSRRELLQQAADTYRTYVRLLGDLDTAQRRLLDAADEYRGFLDQNLIWIPNSLPVNLDTAKDFREAGAWLLSPSGWIDAAQSLGASISAVPLQAAAALLLLLAALALQSTLRRQFRALNDRIGKLSSDSILVTFAALAIAALQVLPVPLALLLVGLGLQETPSPSAFVSSVAAAFMATGPFLYNILLVRVLSAPRGILRTHFSWRDENLAMIRRQIDRVIVIGVPLVFVTVISLTAADQAYRDSLGRVAFVLLMLLFAAVSWPLGHPNKAVGHSYYSRRPDTWLSRLKWLWFGLDVGIPLMLAGLALIGYLYTAAILVEKFVETFWLVLGLVLISLIIRRWLALERRKIALSLARERREARKAERQAAREAQPADGPASPASPEPEMDPAITRSQPLDLDAMGQQTHKLLQAGMLVAGILGGWAIWSDVLPALNVLDEVSLWTQTVTVEGEDTIVPVSLADVLLAALIGLATVVLSRNLPGLMEIAVLRHLELQPGGRYTINTLLRYAVVTIGVVAILNIIGWNWSRIQWLVAALSVGLGFGLQEIVANFVSGLIILFERPVRVGDTVTVGDLTGSVSKVRIRATTITDWDRKEIIVPNKAFITEQVVNWTLSDPITRVVIPVGVSYGSDITLATQVMQDTLRTMPLVLDEPEPRVYFIGFGESSLDFKLYVYSRQLADRLPLTHAVHAAILEALRKHDIEIPFPQRDLHVRSVSDEARGLDKDLGKDLDSGPPSPASS